MKSVWDKGWGAGSLYRDMVLRTRRGGRGMRTSHFEGGLSSSSPLWAGDSISLGPLGTVACTSECVPWLPLHYPSKVPSGLFLPSDVLGFQVCRNGAMAPCIDPRGRSKGAIGGRQGGAVSVPKASGVRLHWLLCK